MVLSRSLGLVWKPTTLRLPIKGENPLLSNLVYNLEAIKVHRYIEYPVLTITRDFCWDKVHIHIRDCG